MSAISVQDDLFDGWQNGTPLVADPGNGGTISFTDLGIAVCVLNPAATETRTLQSASVYGFGQRLLVINNADQQVTINGTSVLSQSGEAIEFIVAKDNGAKIWVPISTTDIAALEATVGDENSGLVFNVNTLTANLSALTARVAAADFSDTTKFPFAFGTVVVDTGNSSTNVLVKSIADLLIAAKLASGSISVI